MCAVLTLLWNTLGDTKLFSYVLNIEKQVVPSQTLMACITSQSSHNNLQFEAAGADSHVDLVERVKLVLRTGFRGGSPPLSRFRIEFQWIAFHSNRPHSPRWAWLWVWLSPPPPGSASDSSDIL